MIAKVHRYFFRYKPWIFFTPNSCQCHTQSFLGLPVHISTVHWSETEGPHYGLGCCQNLEYLDWFKMHIPSWSFEKPFSKKFGYDIWISTLIQQYKNRCSYDTDWPWWVRSNPITCSFLNLPIFKYIPYSTCCLLLFFILLADVNKKELINFLAQMLLYYFGVIACKVSR